MAARDGMNHLITVVRQYAFAGTADHSFNGEAYWSDEHIQDYLDRYRTPHKRAVLEPLEEYVDGESIYKEYPLPIRWVEGTATGWTLRDVAGSAVAGTAYTVDFDQRMVTFANDQGGTAYYADIYAYDLYRAVGDVWETKAAFVSANVDWQSDNHRVSASQEAKFYRDQSRRYWGMSETLGGGFYRMYRVDEA